MAWFKAAGNIRHSGKRYKAGAVVELDAKETKSDLFVPCDAPAGAVKAEPKADKPPPKPKKETVVAPAPAPVVEEKKAGWFGSSDKKTSE